jgi:P27 family predicted phage terminase small subunit
MNDIRRSASLISMDQRRKDKAAQEVQSKADLFQGIPVGAPIMPDWLCDDAKKHWRYCVKHLTVYGLISKIDQGTLANLCTYYARAREAALRLAEHGEFQTSPNGYVQLSPFSVAFSRYSKAYNTLARQFGMTPVSRKSIDTANPNQGHLDLD